VDGQAKGTCVVVGAGPGLGEAVARRFGREGWRVGLIARTPANLERGVRSLVSQGVAARGFPGDAGEVSSLEGALETAAATLGHPAVLVYNAFVSIRSGPADLHPEELAAAFDINVVGALVAAQAVLPAMRAARSGTLLFTGGGLSLHPVAARAALSAGKAALRSLAYCLAEELAPEGIHAATVTVDGVVEPGTHFDPDVIAGEYWRLHIQPPGAYQTEVVFDAAWRPEAGGP